jgi:hypothetical protein
LRGRRDSKSLLPRSLGEMMTNLWVALNLYQEEQLLPECLDSIRRHNPEAKIVAVDGAYESWIQENKKLVGVESYFGHYQVSDSMMRFTVPDSKDRTLEILRDYKVDVIIECEKDEHGQPKSWEHEYVKRSKYFVGQPGDYYLVIDGDERLRKRFDWEKLTAQAYNVWIRRDEEHTIPYPIMRVMKHVNGMRYYGAHHALWVGDVLWRKEMCEDLDFELEHRFVYRAVKDPLRHLAKGAYYRQLTNGEEGPFRRQHGI